MRPDADPVQIQEAKLSYYKNFTLADSLNKFNERDNWLG